jgi:MFS transporter, OFA family, oxalate/formate antiporter
MTMIANLQYGWTLFVAPLHASFGWNEARIQVAFTIFIVIETWLVPVEGWLVDRFGPRVVVIAGGVLCGFAWLLDAYANRLATLYLAAARGGAGAGAVYGAAIGNALKWFPDHRGLAAGLTAGGFGAGAALTVIPIAAMIRDAGYRHAFFDFGLGQGLVIIVVALSLRSPQRDQALPQASSRLRQSAEDRPPTAVLRSPIFWLLYAMFVMVAAGGLMATAQLGPIARDFKVATAPISVFGLTLPALTLALSVESLANGATRPLFGWISDLMGRENTMAVAFALEAIGIWLLSRLGHNPVAFVILSGTVFFAWGEIYSLFPATLTDAFGARFATVNAGMLYTAKGSAALLVPLGNLLAQAAGSWHPVFTVAALMNVLTAALALLLLKPLLSWHVQASEHCAAIAASPPHSRSRANR